MPPSHSPSSSIAESLKVIPDSLSAVPAFEKAFEIAELSNLNREELDIVQRKQIFIEDSRNAVRKGIEQGIEQGKKQEAKAIAIALLDVLDIDTISQKTGLSVEEITTLR